MNLELGVIQERFADIVWANEPVGSGELVKICEKGLWTNSTKISIVNKSGREITVELFSLEDDKTPILEMKLKNNKRNSFTNLTSQSIYFARIRTEMATHISVDIED